MITYLTNILPRLQQYSSDLDKRELFVDRSWIFVDNNNNRHEYIFERDGKLIMSFNGKVIIGNWRILTNNKLLIDRVTDNLMLNNLFLNKDLLILQNNGTNDEPFVMIDEKVIKDLNYLEYLKEFEAKKQNQQALKNPNPRITKTNLVTGGFIRIGDLLENENGVLVTGTFAHITNSAKFFVIENNKVKSIYYVEICQFMYNGVWENLKLHIQNPENIGTGDRILNDRNLSIPIKQKIRIIDSNKETYSIKVNEKLVIYSSFPEIIYLILFSVGIILAFILVLVIYQYLNTH